MEYTKKYTKKVEEERDMLLERNKKLEKALQRIANAPPMSNVDTIPYTEEMKSWRMIATEALEDK